MRKISFKFLFFSAILILGIFCVQHFSYAACTGRFTTDTSGTLMTSLVSYYPMSGNSNDACGTNNGSDSSVTYGSTSGKVGDYAIFNGTSSYINIGSNSSLNITGPLSIAVWVKGSVYSYLLQSGLAQSYSLSIGYPFDGTPLFYNGSAWTSNGSSNVLDGSWHLIIAEVQSGSTVVYVDGTADASSANGYPVSFSGNRILGRDTGGPTYYGGDMDELGIWSKALSSQERADLYNGGSGDTLVPTGNYYAQIENTGGSWNLREGSSTGDSILKTLPEDWIVYVASTTDSGGSPVIANGYQWYKVLDPTDDVDGWMAGANASGTVQYISSYDGSAQSTFEDVASTTQDDEASRATVIQAAVDHYYTNASSTGSLYSSDDLSSVFSSSSPDAYPEDLIFPIAAWEDGGSPSPALNNEEVTFDYGHGIMQITPTPSSSDIYFLQKMLNADPDTQVATSGIGSPGMEGDHFGAATENAVERFQTKYGLASSGQVLYYTRAQLNSMLPTSSIPAIPSAFRFERNLQEGMTDNTSSYSEARGLESGVFIPPCGNLQDPSTSTYYQLCYGDNTSTNPKAYAPQPDYGNQVFKWYANTSQSIYSNIKDGLEILKEKYAVCHAGSSGICSPTNSTSTVDGETFTYDQKRDILATWGYNGFVTSTGAGYLTDIAGRLENINDYFSAIPDPSTATGTWYNKLIVAADNLDTFRVLSPVDVSIVDSEGRATGIVNGTAVAQIPNSEYNPQSETGMVLFPNDIFTFSLKGTANDTYGFIATSNENSATATIYQALNIPIKTGAIHTYTIDFNKLKLGEPGVTIKMDDNGDGKIDRTVTNIGTVSFLAAPKFVAPSFPAAPLKPKLAPPALKIFQVQPSIPTSTTNFTSSTLQISSSSFATTSSIENFTSTIEIASSTIQTNSSTENNE